MEPLLISLIDILISIIILLHGGELESYNIL